MKQLTNARRTYRPLYQVAALSLALLLAACGGGGDGNSGDGDGENAPLAAASLDDMCAKGAEDGSFRYWSQLEPDAWQALYAKFSAAHPGIQVEHLSLETVDMVQRVVAADAARRDPGADLIYGLLESLYALVERDRVMDIDWKTLGVEESLIHPTNLLSVNRVPQGLAYNPERISADELPDTWEELIDPKWAGQVTVDPRGMPFRILAVEWGVDKTMDYVKRLDQVVHPQVIQGGTASMVAVVQGEAMLAAQGRADSAYQLQADGAPIDIKFLDTVSQEQDLNLLLSNAQHGAAAACFAGWLASPEGQEVFFSIEGKRNEDRPEGVPDNVPVVTVQTQEDIEIVNDVAKQISQLWGR